MREVCEYLRVNKGTVSRWISSGRLPAFKAADGRTLRICIKELEKFGGLKLDQEV